MTSPIRIQRRRLKGWRMPPNTRYVGRPSRWGNVHGYDRQRYETWIAPHAALVREELGGLNLACWCPLDAAWCHADTLLKLANQ